MGDAKFKLEDILNKQKAPPQILDLANIKIETEEEFKNVIEKIPDYRIKPERVSLLFLVFIYLIQTCSILATKNHFKLSKFRCY
jgi:hypothetical protein